MKRVVFLVCVFLLACRPTLVSADSCREHEPPKSCPPPAQGIGGHQGTFIEGNGLERFHFALPPGTAFPPPPGTLLGTAAVCGIDRAPVVRVVACQPMPELNGGQGAAVCNVDVDQTSGICTTIGRFGSVLDERPTRGRGVILVRGLWDRRGMWQDTPGMVTLSCDADSNEPEAQQFSDANGAITKCIRQFQIDPSTQHDAFQACIRMVRGDYCGDGRVHTHKRTEIGVGTPLHPVTLADCNDGRCFEASWSKHGAVCIARPRWHGPGMGIDDCASQFVPVGNMMCRGNPADGVVFSRSRQFVCGGAPMNCSREVEPVCTAGAGASAAPVLRLSEPAPQRSRRAP